MSAQSHAFERLKINWMLQGCLFSPEVSGFQPKNIRWTWKLYSGVSSKHLEKQLWFSSRLSIYRYRVVVTTSGLAGSPGGMWCFSVWWITPAVSYRYTAATVSLSKTLEAWSYFTNSTGKDRKSYIWCPQNCFFVFYSCSQTSSHNILPIIQYLHFPCCVLYENKAEMS